MAVLSDQHPQDWKDHLDMDNTTIDEFRNLQEFKYEMSKITQEQDNHCGISYADALSDLINNRGTMSQGDYQIIRNKVKENLLKRGLISDTIYESYKYEVEGDLVDIAKLLSGDPCCCLVPNETYTNHFYELYVSVSYPAHVSDSTIVENMAKILATVELLEQEKYFCKLSLIMPNRGCNNGNGPSNYLGIIPLFSHKDVKTIDTMSSVLNERLLRKFFFARWEDMYGSGLASSYGNAVELPMSIRPVDLDEVDLASDIINRVITPCQTR